EPLFYDTLATDRGHEAWCKTFQCRIPFLNGGLFEPLAGYDWESTEINFPNSLFTNQEQSSQGDIGTGILDVFDRYNFTVNEAEPLEKEVAIDPEMLGKVFENLLEENRRKGLGAFYTPREIVHYMCQESLINYLDTGLSVIPAKAGIQKSEREISRKDLEEWIHQSDQYAHYAAAIAAGTKGEHYPKPPESIRQYAREIDDLLRDILVCDPAIGSGAFPVGMMMEVVRARTALTPYFNDIVERTAYHFKRHAIQSSIYGVDIDVGAVEIAKLRLWLSLVVDEEDVQQIKPLPNLDYKIVVGNSLFGFPFKTQKLSEIEELKKKYFNETDHKKKISLKNQIDTSLSECIKASKRSLGYEVNFDFEIFFSEVFHKNTGFDIVIANPPYVRQEGIKEFKPQLKIAFKNFFCGTADLYTYFYKRGIEVLKPHGHLCFIAPNKFMRAGYGKNIRSLFVKEVTPKVVIDFGDLPIFDATTYPSILLLEKRQPVKTDKTIVATFTDAHQLEYLEKTLSTIGFPMPISELKSDGWLLEQPDVLALMEKLKKAGVPLGEYVQGKFYRGILTGLNDAFVIDEATRERLIAEDPKSKELIKPWLRGRDIKKWKVEWAGLYIIFTRRGTDINDYPAIKRYLEQFRKDLEPKKSDKDKQGRKPGTYKWYEIQDNIAYYEEFERPKIIYPNITKTNIFTFDMTGTYVNQKCFIIPVDDIYLLALLNSRLTTRWFFSTLPLLRGGFFEPSSIFMEAFPVFPATSEQQSSIVKLTKKILSNPDGQDVPVLEKEINHHVYQLYGLTKGEIEIVEK
ncbi:MAG: N-6 DNA methylase, partial [Pseudomonadota bacterium]